jgi:NAD-dependent dihydropyrimidine dehydrogenase PreA subunit
MKRRDLFFPAGAQTLLRWILQDLERGEIFGVHESLFFTPEPSDPFRTTRYGRLLETPLGAAAGPHTQMAQNIVCAWLCGARYVELKTVQALDELHVTKPCIEASDEGYNCEWSQELKLDESFEQYLTAMALLYVLRHALSHPENEEGEGPGFIFNMSAGYDLQGVKSPAMARFLDRMSHCPDEVAALRERLTPLYPALAGIKLPGAVSDNLTLSTMHGCPPEEIERIARHFIEDRRLHVTVKLNPTLLGPEGVRGIVNDTLGYPVTVPDEAFGHDLKYPQALELIASLSAAAKKAGVDFGVKLTNTLEVVNPGNLPENEKMLYLSGRALHPVSVALAAKLRGSFGESLDISFCAGADAFNVASLTGAGLSPVTFCTELLKPGGYGRLRQCVEALRGAEPDGPATQDAIGSFAPAGQAAVTGGPGGGVCAREAVGSWAGDAARTGLSLSAARLAAYAQAAAADPRYRKAARPWPSIKGVRQLTPFDCALAPCTENCGAGQDIPGYLAHAARGDFESSLAVIRLTNPFPNLLGKACDRPCRERCTRIDYDRPVRIREVKRLAAGTGASSGAHPSAVQALAAEQKGSHAAAIRGSTVEGYSCAYFLALAGVTVTIHGPSPAPDAKLLSGEEGALDVSGILSLGVKTSAEEAPSDAIDASASAKGPGGLPLAVGRGRKTALALLLRLGLILSSDATSASRLNPAAQPREATGDSKGTPSLWRVQGGARRESPERAAPSLAAGGLASSASSLVPSLAALALAKATRCFGPGEVKTPGNAVLEAARCLSCGEVCNVCVSVCPNRANVALPGRVLSWPLQRAIRAGGGAARIEAYGREGVRQRFQVANIADFCNECGNCARFCPTAGAPYRDKFRLHLTRESFESAGEGAWFPEPGRMEGVFGGERVEISLGEPGQLRVRTASASAVLDAVTFEARSAELSPGADGADLSLAVRAAVLYTLVSGTTPFCLDWTC